MADRKNKKEERGLSKAAKRLEEKVTYTLLVMPVIASKG